VFTAGQDVLARARDLAADLLEAAPADIGRADGGFCVVGVPARTVSWADVAAAAEEAAAGGPGLAAEADFAQDHGTFPFGAHVAVVDVDTETGSVLLRRLVAVDDCGTVVNPMIVAGQVHGGLAQGVA
jgi:carbon-monoxide dehydrogenase large subunit